MLAMPTPNREPRLVAFVDNVPERWMENPRGSGSQAETEQPSRTMRCF